MPHHARRLAGGLLSLVGLALLGLGLFLFAATLRSDALAGTDKWLMAAIGAATIAGGGWLAKLGRRIGTESGERFLARYHGPVTLYLRSFGADRKADAARGARPDLLHSLPQSLMTEEEQLRLAFADFGPMVAIGRPGEMLPQLGAYRVYTDDASWQDMVRALLARSGLVVMRAGETEGFWWEVEHVRVNLPPERLVILLPGSIAGYEQFRQRAARFLPKELPAFQPGNLAASFGGLMWFDRDWTPRIEASSHALNAPISHAIATDTRRMLRPVYANLGAALPLRPAGQRRLLAIGLDIAVVAAASGIGFAASVVLDSMLYLHLGFLIGVAAAVLPEFTPLRASAGKLLLGLEIVDAGGFPPRLQQLLVRMGLRAALLGVAIGYASLWLIWRERRPLHDLIAGTDLIERSRSRGGAASILLPAEALA